MARPKPVLPLALLASLAACAPASPPTPEAVQLSAVLAGDPEPGFARADVAREFEFPADHGPHPDFRTEWWYLTGHLDAADGRAFGFMFTIFRSALAPEEPDRESQWATRQIYMGHFALTDVAGGEMRAFERFSRGALGLAGATADPFEVWVEDWSLRQGAGDPFPGRLAAERDGVGFDLELTALGLTFLQGEDGLSRKGAAPGNASYYYSIPRVGARGTVTVDGEELPVEGRAWLDREWSTSALEDGQAGWDWFAIQLEDGRAIMLYQLRDADGRPHELSSGKAMGPHGSAESLARADFTIEPLDHWTSPRTGARYPSGWRVAVPSEDLELVVTPRIRDQEMPLSVRYWEGACTVEGSHAGRAYVEMTGYGPEKSD